MKLTFLYQPVDDLKAAVDFHRDELGLEEAWREGTDTVAFALPDTEVQLMLTSEQGAPGPMYLVDDLDAWTAAHPGVVVDSPRTPIPGGAVTGFRSPGGHVFYVFEMPDA